MYIHFNIIFITFVDDAIRVVHIYIYRYGHYGHRSFAYIRGNNTAVNNKRIERMSVFMFKRQLRDNGVTINIRFLYT